MARVIRNVLQEELVNSRRMKQRYEQALRGLGRGSLVMKRISGHPYYYLAMREGGRVRFRYLGKLSAKERQERLAQHRQRGQYRRLLREVTQQIRFLERSLRG
ncbi:MAG: hypothetical protein HYS71_05050 [Candidatus Omnitrophica bacterium]|nr:hypothetical protein [Candidatus Omnitrophota bacterium]MBI2496045.1 hypothetical protein [Candidatus Omnitrophota bacterium]